MAPLCKGSCRRKPTEGLFLQPLSARPASVLRTLANPSNRCAVSEPVSATPANVLRTLANLSHKRGLVKINRAAGAPLLFDFLSSFFSPRSGLFFAIYNK